MSNRAARRAAERATLQAARQAAYASPEPAFVSEAQLAANRENAQKSTGPRTEAGKAAISLNALKTGLTGRTICLTDTETPVYQSLTSRLTRFYSPVGPEEEALVQSVIDIRWRLDRIPGLLMALLNKGRAQLMNEPDFAKLKDADMLDIEVMSAYKDEFRNLNLQESRLSRRREKEIAELKRLQAERKANEAAALETAAAAQIVAESKNEPFHNPGIGFEFSKAVFEAYVASLTPTQKEKILQKALTQASSAAA
jgi:hypothetical protein